MSLHKKLLVAFIISAVTIVAFQAAMINAYVPEGVSYKSYTTKYSPEQRPILKKGINQPYAVSAVQKKLANLRYLGQEDVTGVYNEKTVQAVMAFQGWEGLPISGVMGSGTWAKLDNAQVPFLFPSQIPGYSKYPELKVTAGNTNKRYVVVDLKKQIILIMNTKGGRHFPERILHTSTGKTTTPTHRGNWRVYYKTQTSQIGLQWFSAYDGNYGFHEWEEVSNTPASAGCMRVTKDSSLYLYKAMPMGTPVFIY